MTNEKDLGLLSRTTQLVGGKIPAGTPCPFRSVCRDAPNNCNHKGEQHSVPYSCGTARAFDTFLGLPLDSRTLQQTPTEAPTSTPPSALLHATRLEREGDPQAAAELRRLYQHEMAHKVWLEKTGWVQETSHPWELGMHYADCLKQRIENLQASNAELREVLTHFMPFIESEKDDPRHAPWVAKAVTIATGGKL